VFLVELTGPSGVGKSTIYNKMLEFGGFVKNPILDNRAMPKVNDLIEECCKKDARLNEFVLYMEACFKDAEGRRAPFRHMGTRRALYKSLLCCLADDENQSWMVVDGGLVHRGQGIARLTPAVDLAKYFELLPTPDMTIFITAPRDVLIERNKIRALDMAFKDRSDEVDLSLSTHYMAEGIFRAQQARCIGLSSEEATPQMLADYILEGINIKRNFTGKLAEGYNERRSVTDKWKAEKKIIEGYLDDLADGSWILDVPCGTGRFFKYYESRNFIVRAHDTSADMIAEATKEVTDKMKFRFSTANILETRLEDKSVDASVMCRMTRWLKKPDCQRALIELMRVTRDRIIFTARVKNNPNARPYKLFTDVMDGWKIVKDEPADGDDYRIIMIRPEGSPK